MSPRQLDYYPDYYVLFHFIAYCEYFGHSKYVSF